MQGGIHSDEPLNLGRGDIDGLDRQKYARALARLAENGDTPLVIGLYGPWGMGKTSLMRLIEKELDPAVSIPIWFNPWEHQFDDNPVVALVFKLLEQTDGLGREDGKRLVVLLAAGLASGTAQFSLKHFLGVDFRIKDLLHFGRHYLENQFLIRDTRMHLRQKFEALVNQARYAGFDRKRLIFFIDDLDRCLADEALKLLEALKLYLNLEGCVYFLALNREALEIAVKGRYANPEHTGADYLDKIIQLPFHIPPIETRCMDQFVGMKLSEALQPCREMLVASLGDNPRQVKRFLNKLTLNHQLAGALEIPGYDSRILALLLLVQDCAFSFYQAVVMQPELLGKIGQDTKDPETKALADRFLQGNERLGRVLRAFKVPNVTDLTPYIYLTRVTQPEPKEEPGATDRGPGGPGGLGPNATVGGIPGAKVGGL